MISKERRSFHRDAEGRTFSNTNGAGQMGASYENLERYCADESFIQVYDRTNETRWDDINISREVKRGFQDKVTVLDCAAYRGSKRGALFLKHNAKSNNSSGLNEEVQYMWWNFFANNLDILENQIGDPYENKDTLDPKPLLDELVSFPQTFKQLDEMRAKLSTSADVSNVLIQFYTRDADRQVVGNSFQFTLNAEGSDDLFQERRANGTIVSAVTGQAARDAMFNLLKESEFFNFDDYVGTSAP